MLLNGGLVSWGENYAGSSGLAAPGEGPQEEQPNELVREVASFYLSIKITRAGSMIRQGCVTLLNKCTRLFNNGIFEDFLQNFLENERIVTEDVRHY